MTEKNRCTTQYECKGYCCGDTYMNMSDEEFAIWRDFDPPPEIQSPDSLNLISALIDIATGTGTYYNDGSDNGVNVVIVGPCPQLNQETGDCVIYDSRPYACKNTDLGGPKCRKAREDNDLQPIDLIVD